MMKRVFLPAAVVIAALAAPALAAGPAPAQNKTASGWMQESEREEALELKGDVARGKDIYEVCSACHMPNGWGMQDGTFPQLAGQHTTVTIKQLSDIRAGNRDNPTMYPFALPSEIGGTQAIADVAAYMATLPMTPYQGVGPGNRLDVGAKLYKENCERCHGAHGEGDAAKFYPRLEGQHYNYLVRQFEWIKEGKRRNANPEMVKQIQEISKEDMDAILDYTSRLQVPADKMVESCKEEYSKPFPRSEPSTLCWDNPDFL